MYVENSFAPSYIRAVQHNPAVKPSGAQQCGVKDIRAVCCRDQNCTYGTNYWKDKATAWRIHDKTAPVIKAALEDE